LVGIDDLLHEGETEAHAVLPLREEHVEELSAVCLADARALVLDRERDVLISSADAHGDPRARR
jgi:hypothetical protein